MKIKGSIIKIDQINALAEFSFIHCMYINYLCVLLVLRQKTDPGLKQTPLGLHRPASLTDINILVLKKIAQYLPFPLCCRHNVGVYPVPLYFSKCPLTAMGSGGSARLSTGIVDDRRSLTPRRCLRHTLPSKPHQPTPYSIFSKYKTQYIVCRIACNLTCI